MNNRLKDLKRLCPVPVYFMDTMSISRFSGTYFQSNNYTGKSAFIEVSNDLTNSQKIAVLIHETGHALCDKKNCKCMKNPDHTEREIHANKFMFRQLLKYGLKNELIFEIKEIRQQASGDTIHAYYQRMSKHIMKLKLWQKCLDYIKCQR